LPTRIAVQRLFKTHPGFGVDMGIWLRTSRLFRQVGNARWQIAKNCESEANL